MPKQRTNSIANISPGSADPNQVNPISMDLNGIEPDFANIKNKKISEIIAMIPEGAKKRILKPISGKVTEGFEYKWIYNNQTWRARFHGPDKSAPNNSNSRNGWIVRIQCGKNYMDSAGNFHPKGISNKNSPYFNESLCNDTHIPVQNDIESR